MDDNVGVKKHFLSADLVHSLKLNLASLFSQNTFKDAGTSNDNIVINKLVRSDKIYWLDRAHNNSVENDFFDVMDAFVMHLNRSCYTGITSYEFHYALYEEGSFYSRHLDQFRSNESRKYSMIMYLNEDWIAGDGGELRVHHDDNSTQDIAPESGTGVFFKSNELAHEVLVTNKPRMSVTGWLKVDV
jgi:SM-20-related protein